MEEITKKTVQEQGKILRKHMDELQKEMSTDTQYHDLLHMRNNEKERMAKLQSEIEDWSKKLGEKKEQVESLINQIHERQKVEEEQLASASLEETKKVKLDTRLEDYTLKEIKTEQEANRTKNNDCDSDCDSLGESEWDAVELQASQVTT